MVPRITTILVAAVALGAAAFGQTATQFTVGDRLRWLAHDNLGVTGTLENVAVGAWDTHSNSPEEYGAHWKGFGERVGMITANHGVKSSMEAGLGSLWGEDPRYDRTSGRRFQGRLGHVFAMTFLARNRDGQSMPAYARLIAVPGSSFLSNSWRPDSEASNGDAMVRIGLTFLGHLAGNTVKEFRPRR